VNYRGSSNNHSRCIFGTTDNQNPLTTNQNDLLIHFIA
jgi:hypothetical protein